MYLSLIKTVKKLDDFSIEAIAESGQCFRAVQKSDDVWSVVAYGRQLDIRQLGNGEFEFGCSDSEFDGIWRTYFDLDTDYGIYRSVVLEDDEYLKTAAAFGSGIRMLRQEPWEMLISFIISQRKSVPAIRTSVERLSERFGTKIEGRDAYAFPGPEALAGADTAKLAECGLGYRIDYVRNAAELTACGELRLDELDKLCTEELIAELMKLKGVGIKVASCVALFGYHRLDTVPVDVWMKRVIENVYHGELPEEYRQYAGVLQQYMFNYARLNKVGA